MAFAWYKICYYKSFCLSVKSNSHLLLFFHCYLTCGWAFLRCSARKTGPQREPAREKRRRAKGVSEGSRITHWLVSCSFTFAFVPVWRVWDERDLYGQESKSKVICLTTEHHGVHMNSFRNVRSFQGRIGIWKWQVTWRRNIGNTVGSEETWEILSSFPESLLAG